MTTLDGPSLSTYIETRFNLLTEVLKDKVNAQDAAIVSVSEATKAAVLAAKAAADAAAQANDLRYQQRFEAQSDALSAAFLSQQTAMQTAFVVAEKAVQAALAAADRAVSKAELAADKRFEALNELRSMLTDMVANLVPKGEAQRVFDAITEKIDAISQRLEKIDGRVISAEGVLTGNKQSKDNTRLYIGLAITVVLAALALASFVLARINTP